MFEVPPLFLKIVEASFEVAGAFLLAVEAIKTRNLRRLALRLRLYAIRALPIVRAMAGDESAREPNLSWQTSVVLFAAVAIIGLPIGAFLWALGDFGTVTTADKLREFFALDPGWIGAVAYLPKVVSAVAMGVATGVFVLGLFLELLGGIARGLIWIERHTESGIVGIMGFLCFLVYAIMKFMRE